MDFNVTVEITPLELKHIITDYLKHNSFRCVSDQDIHFIVEEVKKGDPRDPWKCNELTKVLVKNIKIGTPNGPRD